jgi:CheY-like chemotaxis protein
MANDAENGKAALDRLEQSPIPPALILLDLHMPVMDGITFLQRLKAIPRLRPIPVLLMTAQSSPPSLEVAAILLKPFALNSLLSLVKQWATVRQRKSKPRRGVAVRGDRT